ncbi:hypothetical protein JEP8_238 [Escherichia phage JEP8]|uniref:Uncharacterized protein n=16 Tax=Krischvirus TaxID=1913651 RepID=A0A6B9WYJ9_9CAUD|nr:hypothetical protein RB49p117 [Escherichia phage RB49]YP_001469461.1 hypothetical protein phi1p117 [Escherichia phage Phi1]YP_002922192.1 hypothetical protein EpJSE_00120 [Escherichia phage JSE]YP_009118801.1 hypothetical protein BN201_0118 [Enterobacteria phage GEC-3S]YP_009602080.1 hypothetical protein FDH53_gp115 [Escherichia phage ECD7]YP_010097142.1 hypothetical protein KNU01_gp008 [Escherichia virus KFS-EC]AUV64076.1 hypothetical protein Sf20_gp257 [Shigella phage Sf20]EHU9813569.1 
MARRITKALKAVSKENVVAILVIWGYNEESAKQKVEAGFELAVKAMPNDDSVGLANYIAYF